MSDLVADYSAQQLYRTAAPTGIDIDYLRGNFWNARGINWGYTDIEYNWNQNHADLSAIASSSVAASSATWTTRCGKPCWCSRAT